jgi:hypothetical protein
MPFGSELAVYVSEVAHPLHLWHCAPVGLGPLEQMPHSNCYILKQAIKLLSMQNNHPAHDV